MSAAASEFKRSGAAKSTVSEVGSGRWFADSWRSRRSKRTSDGVRLDVTAEVDWGGSVVDLVRQDGQLVVDPLSNQEPMQLLKEWLRWRSSGALQNDTPQCSTCTAASEYCWLELHATQRCSSPAETASGCMPE